jgi:hypothetical protein
VAEGKFKNLSWMHVTPAGVIYFIDLCDLYKIENGKIIAMAKNLHERTPVFEFGSIQHNVFGIWLDQAGNVYVAVHGSQVVKKITQDGTVSDIVYSEGDWRPSGGLFDDPGNLWVMETNGANEVRVRKISPDKLIKAAPASDRFINKSRTIFILTTILLGLTAIIFAIVKLITYKRKINAFYSS